MGLMPRTRIASSSSRIVRAPRSAHMAVLPAPATTSTVTRGPIWVTAARAAVVPEKSAAPNSSNSRLRVNTLSTVNGIASITVGSSDTRATNQPCSSSSRHANGGTNINRKVSRATAKNPPTARIGLMRGMAVLTGLHYPGGGLCVLHRRNISNRRACVNHCVDNCSRRGPTRVGCGTLRRCQVCWYSGGGGDSAIVRFARCATSTRVGMLATARGYRASGFGYAPTSQTLSTKLLTGPNSGVVLHTSGDSEEEAGPLCTDTSWLKTRRLHDIRQTAEPSRRGFRSSDRRVGEQPVADLGEAP